MVKLSSVAEILNGDRSSNYPSGKDFIAYGIPFINAGHLKNGKIDFSNMDYISKQKYEQLSGAKIQKKDILLCLRGSLGKYAVAEIDAGAPASSIAVIRPNETIIASEFLTCIISSFLFQKQIDLENNGSSQPNLSASSVANFIIPFPPLDEQKRIAEALSDVDELISSLEKLIEKYKSIKATCLQQMFSQKGDTTPKMRLPGFTGAWEQRKFDEVFDCTIPNNTLSRAELNYENGSVRNIHYGDILIKYGSIVDVQNDEIPFATGKSSDDFKGALLQDGDIIIADTAEDETTGKACEIGNSQGLDVVSGLHTMVCRPHNKMALGYLGYYLNSNAYHHQLLPLMQGIKVLSLSRTNVQKTMVCYPKSNAEQQLIADCFRNLDNLITLHQRKLDKAKKIKQGMMQQLLTGKIRLV